MVGTAPDVKKDNGNRAALDATAGAIAGAIARLVVNPLDVLKIRFQVQLEPISASQPVSATASVLSKYTGLRQAFVTIVKEEGIKVSSCQRILSGPFLQCHERRTQGSEYWERLSLSYRCLPLIDGLQCSHRLCMQVDWMGTLPSHLFTASYVESPKPNPWAGLWAQESSKMIYCRAYGEGLCQASSLQCPTQLSSLWRCSSAAALQRGTGCLRATVHGCSHL